MALTCETFLHPCGKEFFAAHSLSSHMAITLLLACSFNTLDSMKFPASAIDPDGFTNGAHQDPTLSRIDERKVHAC